MADILCSLHTSITKEMYTVVSPVGFAFFISPELFYTANTSIKDSQVKQTEYSVCEGKREMEQSHHLSHIAGMKTAQISVQTPAASQILPKHHWAHKPRVAAGPEGVMLLSARGESMQESL